MIIAWIAILAALAGLGVLIAVARKEYELNNLDITQEEIDADLTTHRRSG